MNTQAAFTRSASPLVRLPRASSPLVSFITVTFGTARIVERSLEALATTTEAVDAEFIVVDNPHPVHGHRTANRLALNTSGLCLVQPTQNLGFGGGNEFGVLHARGDILCFANPDLLPTPGWFEPLLAAVRAHPDRIVAPRLINPDGSLQESGQRLSASGHTRPRFTREPLGGHGAAADYASAACWVMTRSLHERSGGFDARFHPAYFEDVDLALRVRSVGDGTMIVDSDVVHLHGGSTADPEAPPAEQQRAVLRHLWASELRRQPTF